MLKRFRYMIMLAFVLFSFLRAEAQTAMPDHANLGATKHYNVTANPGSSYTWWVDGVQQVGITTNEIDLKWTSATPNPHKLEVQEQNANGCDGPKSSGDVFINDVTLAVTGHDPIICSENGSIDFTFTGVPDGTYTINYDGGFFSNVAVTGSKASVAAPVGVYNNLTITVAGNSSPPGVNVTISAASDLAPPTFTMPGAFTGCVEDLISVKYNVLTGIVEYNQPDYYTFNPGDKSLDITGIADNCCAVTSLQIHWRIEFSGGSIISGTGQLSQITSPIQFPGDGVNYDDTVHEIFYWMEDCNNNKSAEQSQKITIKPRPNILNR